MRAQHLAIDGSVVSFEADADLDTGATATGWAIAPTLMRTQPFSIHPSGHSKVVEDSIREHVRGVQILDVNEFEVQGRRLRVFDVELPGSTGTQRRLTVGAWEGIGGCLATSLRGAERERLVELFGALPISDGRRGIAIRSRVTVQPRVPEVSKEIRGLGIVAVRPAIACELERLPRRAGMRVRGGELFRARATGAALVHVSDSAVTRATPLDESRGEELLAVVRDLRVEWKPARQSVEGR